MKRLRKKPHVSTLSDSHQNPSEETISQPHSSETETDETLNSTNDESDLLEAQKNVEAGALPAVDLALLHPDE